MANRLKRLWTATITRQLVLGIALVHALLMTVFVFDLVTREREFLIEQSQAEALSLAEALAATGTSWVLAHDVVGLEELIAAQSSYPGLQYAMFVDPDGQVLAYSDRNQVGRYLADPVSRRLLHAVPRPQVLVDAVALIDVAAPVLKDDSLVGWARVGVSRGAITANLERVTRDGLAYTVGAIVLGSLFAWFMAFGLTTGIRRLAAASRRVRQGERDVAFTLDRHDELGRLADSFALMVHTLAAREREAAENNALLHSIIDATPDLIFFKDTEGVYQGCNRAFADFVGRPQSEIVGRTDYRLFSEGAAKQLRADDAAALDTQQMFSSEERGEYPDGRRVLLDTVKTPYYGPGGEVLGVLGISRDITARKAAEEENRRSRASLAEAQRIGHIGSWELDLQTFRLIWSDEVYRIFGLVPADFDATYAAFLACVHPEDREDVDTVYRASVEAAGRYRIEHRILLPDGGMKYVEEQGETEYAADGSALRSVGTVQDITERHLAREALEKKQAHLDWLAHYDALTQLPNRLLFRDRLDQAVRRAERDRDKVAVMFIDLDEFKQINDSLGHAVGDRVLTEVARRFQAVVRGSDSVARLGGDEFTVILNGLHDPQHVTRVASELIDVLQEPIRVDDRDLFVSTSIGISIYPDDSEVVDQLLSNADAAMFEAKERGRNNFQFYTRDMTTTAYDRIQLETELRQALKRDEFFLCYQPQYDLESGRMTGMEALLRWRHPEQGEIAPGRFIPTAEASGFILAIGEWVLEEAARQACTWRDEGLDPGRIAINLSGKQIYQKDLAAQVRRSLEKTGCPAEWLGLEVTEGFIMTDPEHSIGLLGELRAMGFALAIDDFGTGYSSLAYLKQLPIDKLKIDKSFVRDIPDDPNDMAIAQAVLALGRSLGIGVVAEGVETPAQESFLRANGCHEVQGFLYSRPLPAEEVVELLAERNPGTPEPAEEVVELLAERNPGTPEEA